MTGTFRARYRNGVIKPLEKIDLPENSEVTITITEARPENAADALERSAGSWKGTTPSARTLIRRIYSARRAGTRRSHAYQRSVSGGHGLGDQLPPRRR